MEKAIFIIMFFVLTLVTSALNGFIQSKGKIRNRKMFWRNVYIPILLGILTSILSAFIYDSIRSLWFEESVSSGILRGNYPYFVVVNEQYGNLCITLENDTSLENAGYEISIQYPNSDYSRVIEMEYEEPIWINIEPLEYEIVITLDGEYIATYPCKVEEHMINRVTFPIS